MSKRSRSPWSSRHIRCTGSYMLLLHPCTYTRRDIVQLTAKYVAWLYVVLSIPHFLVLSKKRQVSVGIQTCCVYDDVTRLVKEITCHDGLLSLEMHLKASVHLRAVLAKSRFQLVLLPVLQCLELCVDSEVLQFCLSFGVGCLAGLAVDVILVVNHWDMVCRCDKPCLVRNSSMSEPRRWSATSRYSMRASASCRMIIFIAFLFLVIQISLSPMSLDLFNYVEETYAQHSE